MAPGGIPLIASPPLGGGAHSKHDDKIHSHVFAACYAHPCRVGAWLLVQQGRRASERVQDEHSLNQHEDIRANLGQYTTTCRGHWMLLGLPQPTARQPPRNSGRTSCELTDVMGRVYHIVRCIPLEQMD